MEETVLPEQAPKEEGFDMFQYIKDQINALKMDLEDFIEQAANKPHHHGIADILDLQESLNNIYSTKQDAGTYSKEGHRHDIRDTMNATVFVKDLINESQKDLAQKYHSHTEYEKGIEDMKKTVKGLSERQDMSYEIAKDNRIDIVNISDKIDDLSKRMDKMVNWVSAMDSKVERLSKKEPIEIVMKVRDEEKFIVPIKARDFTLKDVIVTDGATAKVYSDKDEMKTVSGGEVGLVVVNKPCLVHLIFHAN